MEKSLYQSMPMSPYRSGRKRKKVQTRVVVAPAGVGEEMNSAGLKEMKAKRAMTPAGPIQEGQGEQPDHHPPGLDAGLQVVLGGGGGAGPGGAAQDGVTPLARTEDGKDAGKDGDQGEQAVMAASDSVGRGRGEGGRRGSGRKASLASSASSRSGWPKVRVQRAAPG